MTDTNTTTWTRTEYGDYVSYKCDGDRFDLIVGPRDDDNGGWEWEAFEHSAVGGYTDRWASGASPNLDSAMSMALIAAETAFSAPAPAGAENA